MRESILRRAGRLLCLAGALALAAPIAAQTAQTAQPAQAPGGAGASAAEPGAELKIILLTMGPGDAVYERFGHNAIWVHDPTAGTDVAYNYGMFDFASENFFLNFARGRMMYWMEGFDAYRMMEAYRLQNRTIWGQELNLTPRQKIAVRDFLQWNAREENRFYRYDYYRDNCSTRVRDVVDRVLGGAFRAAMSGPSGTTYRWHTRRLTGGGAPDAGIYTGLEAGLGPAADRSISKWEEMFLPMKLRDGVRQMRVRDASGREVPLLLAENVIFQAQRAPERDAPPSWMPGYLVAGVLLAGLLALLGRAAPRSRGARFGFGALSALWLLFAGTGGLILAGLWSLTDHAIAYGNENLLQLSPLALPLVLLLPAAAYGARWARRPAWLLTAAVAALSLLGLVLQVLPGVDQVNGEIIALALPVSLALAWVARRLATAAPGAPAPAAPRRAARPEAATA